MMYQNLLGFTKKKKKICVVTTKKVCKKLPYMIVWWETDAKDIKLM